MKRPARKPTSMRQRNRRARASSRSASSIAAASAMAQLLARPQMGRPAARASGVIGRWLIVPRRITITKIEPAGSMMRRMRRRMRAFGIGGFGHFEHTLPLGDDARRDRIADDIG